MPDVTPAPVQITTTKEAREQIEREASRAFPRVIDGPAVCAEALRKYEADPAYRNTLDRAMFVLQGIDRMEKEWQDEYWNAEEGGASYYVTESLAGDVLSARTWKLVRVALDRLPEDQKLSLSVAFPEFDRYFGTLATLICPDCGGVMNVRATHSEGYVTTIEAGVEVTKPDPLAGVRVSHVRDLAYKMSRCRTGQQWFQKLIGLGTPGAMKLDFLTDTPERQEPAVIEWLVDGIFARGDYWSLFGPAGVGKSLLALDWSLQAARKGYRVLYLDKENPEHMIEDRLKAMGATAEDVLTLAVVPFCDVRDLATQDGADDLLQLVEGHRSDLIVLDTISKFSQSGQATQSDRWQKIYNIALSPLLKREIAIGQIDHTGLSDSTRERDSSAKRDNVSLAFALNYRGPDRLSLTRVKNRPNHPGEKVRRVSRIIRPVLTHAIEAGVDQIDQLITEMDKLKLPTSVGRTVAATALREAGVEVSNAALAEAIKERKERT